MAIDPWECTLHRKVNGAVEVAADNGAVPVAVTAAVDAGVGDGSYVAGVGVEVVGAVAPLPAVVVSFLLVAVEQSSELVLQQPRRDVYRRGGDRGTPLIKVAGKRTRRGGCIAVVALDAPSRPKLDLP